MERIKTDQGTDLSATSSFAETDLSLAARLLSRLNRLTQSVFRFSRDNYTPALPINSPPGAQGEGPPREDEERTKNHARGERLKK